MSKAVLKAAMRSLQVKTPLRLPSGAPTFKPPAPSPATSFSEKSSWDEKTSQDRIRSQDTNSPEDSRENSREFKEEQSRALDVKPSQDENGSTDELASQVPIAPRVIPRASQPRRATEQDQAVVETASVTSRLSTGYTRIPNSVLMTMVSGDLSRNEMKLLLLIARMTISFNRPLASLSKNVIERMTGIQGRSVLEALQSLEKAGRVRKLAGDHNKPNQLGLIYESPFAERTQDEKSSQDTKSTWDANSPQGWGEISPYKKDSFETKRKKISLSSVSEIIRSYFSELQPKRKRETELKAFRDLREGFTDDQIALALAFVQRNGTLHTQSPCHSPMAYLAHAMTEVLAETARIREVEERTLARTNSAEEQRRREEEERAREAIEFRIREEAFNREFPCEDRQSEVISEYCLKSRLKLRGEAARTLAIQVWWDESGKRLYGNRS